MGVNCGPFPPRRKREMGVRRREQIDRAVDFHLREPKSGREPHRSDRPRARHTHRREGRRDVDLARVAGRAGGRRDPRGRREEVHGEDAGEAHRERVREDVFRVAVPDKASDPRRKAGEETVAERAGVGGPGHEVPRREFARLPEPDDPEQVLRARAPPALVARAEHELRELHAPPDVERADALRAVDLVAGDREQVDAEVVRRRPAPCRRAWAASVWTRAPRGAGERRRSRRSAARSPPRCSRASR